MGCSQSPTNAKFWLPNRSIWLPPMITCRRPDHTMSNICRYGFHDSIVLTSSVAPTGYGPAMSSASPSVITRSGSKLARARRPPIIGTLPIGLARISPSPRKHSAIATTQYSARVIRSPVAHRPTTFRYSAWSPQSRYFALHSAHASGVFALAAYDFWNSSSRG